MSQQPAPPPAPPVENPFAKFPDWLLADTLGDLDAQADKIADRVKLAKAEMDRRHRVSLTGTRFTVTKSVEVERRLDSKALKAKYGLPWYEGWYKPANRTKWTITLLAAPEVGTSA